MPGRLGTTGAECGRKGKQCHPSRCAWAGAGKRVSTAVANMNVARHKGRGVPRRVRSRASLRQLARAEVDTDTRLLCFQIGHVV